MANQNTYTLKARIPLNYILHLNCDTMLLAFISSIILGYTIELDRLKRKDDGIVCFDDSNDLPIATVSTLTTVLGSWPNRIWTFGVMISAITRLSIVPLILYKQLKNQLNNEISRKPAIIAICSCLEHLAVMGLVFLYWSLDFDSYMKLKHEKLETNQNITGTFLPDFENYGHYVFFSVYAFSFLTSFFLISSFDNYRFVKKWAFVLVGCLLFSTGGFFIRESNCVPYSHGLIRCFKIVISKLSQTKILDIAKKIQHNQPRGNC